MKPRIKKIRACLIYPLLFLQLIAGCNLVNFIRTRRDLKQLYNFSQGIYEGHTIYQDNRLTIKVVPHGADKIPREGITNKKQLIDIIRRTREEERKSFSSPETLDRQLRGPFIFKMIRLIGYGLLCPIYKEELYYITGKLGENLAYTKIGSPDLGNFKSKNTVSPSYSI